MIYAPPAVLLTQTVPYTQSIDVRVPHTMHFNVRKGAHRLAIGVLDSSSQEWSFNALTIDGK